MPAARSGGFSAKGGGQPRATRAVGYSEAEMTAISKLNPNPGFDGPTAKLCDICGRPLVSTGPYDNPEVVIPYDVQARIPHELDSTGKPRGYGRHATCHTKKQEKTAADQRAAYEALPEDEKARRFNESNDAQIAAARAEATGDVNARVEPYRFKPGELPLKKVEAAGGVSKIFVEPKPTVATQQTGPAIKVEESDADELARLQQQQDAIEAELAANFAREQALATGELVEDTSEHDAAAASTGLSIPLGDEA